MDIETAKQAMGATINLLGEIQVPVALHDSICKPIFVAINNLQIGLAALENNETETAEVKEDGDADAG